MRLRAILACAILCLPIFGMAQSRESSEVPSRGTVYGGYSLFGAAQSSLSAGVSLPLVGGLSAPITSATAFAMAFSTLSRFRGAAGSNPRFP